LEHFEPLNSRRWKATRGLIHLNTTAYGPHLQAADGMKDSSTGARKQGAQCASVSQTYGYGSFDPDEGLVPRSRLWSQLGAVSGLS
jgi:hypothetical protein